MKTAVVLLLSILCLVSEQSFAQTAEQQEVVHRGDLLPAPYQAQKACSFKENIGWRCGGDGLNHYNISVTETKNHPSSIDVTTTITTSNDCFNSITLSIKHQNGLTVDWSKVSVSVAGRSRQIAPGYARVMTSGLTQKPSIAEPGITIDETLWPIDGEKCLAPIPPPGTTVGIILTVPYESTGLSQKVVVTNTFNWRKGTEKEALAALPNVFIPDAPIGTWGWTVGLGIAGALPCFAISGFSLASIAGGTPASQAVPAAASTTAIGTLAGVAGAGLGYLFWDSRKLEKQAEHDAAIGRSEALAYRRRELGISVAESDQMPH